MVTTKAIVLAFATRPSIPYNTLKVRIRVRLRALSGTDVTAVI
jgi:hypothetical protein